MVWCPRYRRRVLANGVDVRVNEVTASVADEYGVFVIDVVVSPDHVRRLIEIPSTVALCRVVRALKGRSSRGLRQEFPRLGRLRSLWTRWWFVSTVGGARLGVVGRHVENQRLVA